jgi:hypothetical protein
VRVGDALVDGQLDSDVADARHRHGGSVRHRLGDRLRFPIGVFKLADDHQRLNRKLVRRRPTFPVVGEPAFKQRSDDFGIARDRSFGSSARRECFRVTHLSDDRTRVAGLAYVIWSPVLESVDENQRIDEGGC